MWHDQASSPEDSHGRGCSGGGGAMGNSSRSLKGWEGGVFGAEPPGSLDGSNVGVKGRRCHGQLTASDLDEGVRGPPPVLGGLRRMQRL